MSVIKPEDEGLSSRNIDEAESPRKKMRMDNSGRKSWSLMDRKTDHEVLQEMGVSLLDPDEGETYCDPGVSALTHKSQKRKRDIENVNPNINLITSPRIKHSPRSPRAKTSSPNAGPSRIKSPRSSEKLPLQPTDLETTLIEDYLIDEETPLAQMNACYLPASADYDIGDNSSSCSSTKNQYMPLVIEDELIISRRHKPCPGGPDTFNMLSDEMILSVFKWLPKRTLSNCMLVCKRWHRVACDETLWQRLDLGNKTLSKDALGRILARKPVIVRLASSEIGEWHPTVLPAASRIQYLDLSMANIDVLTLNNLLSCCPILKKLSLESILLNDGTAEIIGKFSNLETLNLTMAQGLTAEGLKYILTGCTELLALNISWCNLDEAALEVLVEYAPEELQRLNLSGARILTDDIVARLAARVTRLSELDVSDCGRLALGAAAALGGLARLQHVALSRCYLLPPAAIARLAALPALQHVDAWGTLPAAALHALCRSVPHLHLNAFMFSAIARPTVGTRRTSIWGLRTRD